MKKPETYWEEVTPDLAKEYLTLNKENRPLSQTKVDEWAKEMKQGKWRQTHQGIAFDWDGNLLDGQHRLAAIVASGRTVKLMITANLDPETYRVIDDGMARDSKDLLVVAYKKKFGETPARANYVTSVSVAMLRGLTGKKIHKEQTTDNALRHYKLIQELVPLIATKTEAGTVSCAAFANAVLYFGKEKILPLALRYKSEMWASQTDPLKALFTKLSRAKMQGELLPQADKYALVVAAIRAALAGETRSKLAGTAQDFGDAELDRRLRSK